MVGRLAGNTIYMMSKLVNCLVFAKLGLDEVPNHRKSSILAGKTGFWDKVLPLYVIVYVLHFLSKKNGKKCKA